MRDLRGFLGELAGENCSQTGIISAPRWLTARSPSKERLFVAKSKKLCSLRAWGGNERQGGLPARARRRAGNVESRERDHADTRQTTAGVANGESRERRCIDPQRAQEAAPRDPPRAPPGAGALRTAGAAPPAPTRGEWRGRRCECADAWRVPCGGGRRMAGSRRCGHAEARRMRGWRPRTVTPALSARKRRRLATRRGCLPVPASRGRPQAGARRTAVVANAPPYRCTANSGSCERQRLARAVREGSGSREGKRASARYPPVVVAAEAPRLGRHGRFVEDAGFYWPFAE